LQRSNRDHITITTAIQSRKRPKAGNNSSNVTDSRERVHIHQIPMRIHKRSVRKSPIHKCSTAIYKRSMNTHKLPEKNSGFSRKPKLYFEFYVDGKLEAAGSLRKALREINEQFLKRPLLEIHGIQFQVSREKPHSYRLVIPLTLLGDLDGEVTYDMKRNEMFQLVQSAAKYMPSKRAVLMETCK
jgi:hypothetical protein